MFFDSANSRSLKLLVVGDSPADAEIMLDHLRQAGFTTEVRRVDTEAAYRRELSSELDLVLSDHEMALFTGLRALQLLRERAIEVPFIIVSGRLGEETAVEMMRLGAADCVPRDRLGRLAPAVERALAASRLRREQRGIEAALRENEAWLRMLADFAQVGLAIIDEEHRYRYANPAYARVMNFPTSDLAGWRVADIYGDSYETEIRPRLDRAFAGESIAYEVVRPAPGGEQRLSVSCRRGLHGAKAMVVVGVVDRSEHGWDGDALADRAN